MTKLTSDYFSVVDPEPLSQEAGSAVFASGTAYRVERRNSEFILSYLSGAHQGGEKTIVIDEQQAFALGDGSITLDEVLIAHGAS